LKKTFIFWGILFITKIFSQDISPLNVSGVFDRENPKYKSSLEQFYKERTITRITSSQVLEKEINENEYNLGPGDQLAIYILGELEFNFTSEITPEGYILIPTIGSIKISGLTLKNAKEILKSFIKQNYHSSKIEINLVGLRKFRVYVVGEIETPGTYFAQASDRVSDIIEIAGGTKSWADDTRIQVFHENNKVDTLNLLDFYAYGNKNNNPTLRGGDVIYIPALDLSKPHVTIEYIQNIKTESKINPGIPIFQRISKRKIMRIFNNERLIDFINRLAILNNTLDLSNISIIRNDEEFKINLAEEYQKDKKFILQNKDLIVFPELLDKVYVQGEVLNPGRYQYKANLRAIDYVSTAGVFEKTKTGKAIKVIRRKTGEILKGQDVLVEKGDIIIVPRKRRESIRDNLSIITPVLSLIISSYTLYLAITNK